MQNSLLCSLKPGPPLVTSHFSLLIRRRLILLALVSERNFFSVLFRVKRLSRAVRPSDGTSFCCCCCCWLQTLVRIRLLMAVCLPHFMDRGGGESAGYDAVRRPRYVAAAAAAARADVVPRVRWASVWLFVLRRVLMRNFCCLCSTLVMEIGHESSCLVAD
jgi:hypothetical protein